MHDFIERAKKYTKFVAIDIETSGLDEKTNSPIQIGATRFTYLGKEVSTYTNLFRPKEGCVSQGAFSVHGISYDDIKSCRTWGEYGTRMVAYDFCHKYPIVAYNLDLVFRFLDFKHVRIPEMFNLKKMCQILFKNDDITLESCIRQLAIPITKSLHRADHDAWYMSQIFLKIIHSTDTPMVVPPKIPVPPQEPPRTEDLPAVFIPAPMPGLKPYKRGDDLVIPFDSAIENQWWKKNQETETFLYEQEKVIKDKYGNTRTTKEKVFDTKKTHQGVKFLSLNEIETNATKRS